MLLSFFLLRNPAMMLVIDSDWHEGFHHPLEGWDHILTMIAAGIWAAQSRGQAVWVLPLVFASVMSLGGLIGAVNIALPYTENIILLSVLLLNVFVIRKIQFNAPLNILIIALFAFFHGYAHGQEISASASLISYTAGFVWATLLLHGTGILIARLVILALAFSVGNNVHAQEAAKLTNATPEAMTEIKPETGKAKWVVFKTRCA